MRKNKLPEFLKKYFWDVDFEKIDEEKGALFIIHRFLDRGNDKAIRWMWRTYSKNLISEGITKRRGFSPCALQIGHRVSLDLDFFTEKEFDTEIILEQLKKLSGFKLDETAKWTILGS